MEPQNVADSGSVSWIADYFGAISTLDKMNQKQHNPLRKIFPCFFEAIDLNDFMEPLNDEKVEELQKRIKDLSDGDRAKVSDKNSQTLKCFNRLATEHSLLNGQMHTLNTIREVFEAALMLPKLDSDGEDGGGESAENSFKWISDACDYFSSLDQECQKLHSFTKHVFPCLFEPADLDLRVSYLNEKAKKKLFQSIKKLSENDRRSIVEKASRTIKCLNSLLEEEALADHRSTLQFAKAAFYHLKASENVVLLCDFANIIEGLDRAGDESVNRLLAWNPKTERIELKSVSDISAARNKGQQDKVNFTLRRFLSIFGTGRALAKLPVNRLFQLLAICEWMMVNYAVHREMRLDLMMSIFSSLLMMREKIRSTLLQRVEEQSIQDKPVVAEDIEQYYQLAISLRDQMEKLDAFPDRFLTEKEHEQVLDMHFRFWDIYRSVRRVPSARTIDGYDQMLHYLGKGSAIDFRLFVAGGEDQKILMLFIDDCEDAGNYYGLMTREPEIFNVNGYEPVIRRAVILRNELMDLMRDIRDDPEDGLPGIDELSIIIVGYGIGAAVGQMVGFDLAERCPKIHSWAFCFGAPDFLEVEDAQRLLLGGKNQNYYGVNFVSADDRLLKQGPLSQLLNISLQPSAHSYSVTAKIRFFSDWANGNHCRSLYNMNLGPSMAVPLKLKLLYTQIDQFVDSIGNVEDNDNLKQCLQVFRSEPIGDKEFEKVEQLVLED